jgi:hypothetical protein
VQEQSQRLPLAAGTAGKDQRNERCRNERDPANRRAYDRPSDPDRAQSGARPNAQRNDHVRRDVRE